MNEKYRDKSSFPRAVLSHGVCHSNRATLVQSPPGCQTMPPFVCVCRYMRVYVCAHVYRDQRLIVPSFIVWRQDFLLNLELSNFQLGWLSTSFRDLPVYASLTLGLQAHTATPRFWGFVYLFSPSFFNMGSRNLTQLRGLAWQALYSLSHLPRPFLKVLRQGLL